MPETTTTDNLVEVQYSLVAPHRQRIEVTTTGEASAIPGLAIVPCLNGGWPSPAQFTGGWEVRHVASGFAATRHDLGLGHARDAAALLGELDVDWTQPREVAEAVVEASRDRVYDIFDQIEDATEQARPARMHSSWEQLECGWFIYDTTAEDVVAGCFDDVADAEKELRYLTRIGQHAGCVIRREDREPWALRCAWVDCRGPLGADERLSHPDPAGVTEFAEGDGWRRLDAQHWLCPHCSYLFASIHQL